MSEKNEYKEAYSEAGYWEKVSSFAKDAGYEVIEKTLFLYYTLDEDDVPFWAKGTILGGLGYFISPIDAIPDLVPAVGYSDDLGVLVLAVANVATCINDNVKRKAKRKLKDWFGE